MATNTPTDQPSQVTTEEQLRPRDEDVVTSDLQKKVESKPGDQEGNPAAAADQQQAPKTDEPASSDQNPEPSRRNKRSSRDRRIDRLNKTVANERARNDANEARIAELEATIAGLKEATPAAPEPQLADFDSPQKYAKAYADWEKSQQSPPASKTPPAKSTPTHSDKQPAAPEKDAEVAKFMDRGTKKLGDEFLEATQERDLGVNQQMAEFMMDSEFGPEIYVHLANNVSESHKIYDSGPDRASAMLKDLEAKAKNGELDVDTQGTLKVEGDDDHTEPPTNKPANSRQTRAPAPPSDTKEGGTASLKPDPENESMDEYAARRRKEEARRMGLPV